MIRALYIWVERGNGSGQTAAVINIARIFGFFWTQNMEQSRARWSKPMAIRAYIYIAGQSEWKKCSVDKTAESSSTQSMEQSRARTVKADGIIKAAYIGRASKSQHKY